MRNDLDKLPRELYTADEVRELDRIAIEELGVPGIRLMQRAGQAVFNAITTDNPEPSSLTVVCGTGNNGGDGFIVAALAAQKLIPVRVLLVGDADKIGGDARLAYLAATQEGVNVEQFGPELISGTSILVDALLGTGLKGEVRSEHAAAINSINSAEVPVYAVDIPSGLCSDSGMVLGVAVNATKTMTFIGLKRGLFTGSGPARTGQLMFNGLEVSEQVRARLPAAARLLPNPSSQALLEGRRRDAHKGDCGHVLIIGGDRGMGGAVAMAGEAALRCGAGLVSVATHQTHVGGLLARRPELMVHGVDSGEELEPLLARASVVAIGPGLGVKPWGEQMLQKVLSSTLPLIADADALNLYARHPDWVIRARGRQVLTTHPGEAARLLDFETKEIQRDRFEAVTALQRHSESVVVLKGVGTLVLSGDNEGVCVCPYGNPGMASGGMGDVLTGVIAALIAQGLKLSDAARWGVSMHSFAADAATVESGERGLLASDLIPWLQKLVNTGDQVTAID